MATLSAGYTFGATETVTNAKLAALVNSGSISNIAQTDLTAGQGLVNVGTSAPSDTDQVWVDTSSTPPILRFYDSNRALWVTSSDFSIFTNRSGQTGASGRVLILDTTNSNSYTYTSTAGDTKFLGIETASVSNTSQAPVVMRGSVVVNLELSASAGTYIRTSTASGKAEPCVNTAAGVFGFLTEAGTASARSNVFGIDPNGTLDQTASYTWTGTHTFNGTVVITTASATTTNWSPIVQIVQTSYSASATGTTTLPLDDTIPQNNEGDEYMSRAITPKNSNNRLIIEALWVGAMSGAGSPSIALFQDSTADALMATFTGKGSTDRTAVFLSHEMQAGTTASTTFKIRAGIGGAGTTAFNSDGSTRIFGTIPKSYIRVTEKKV